MLEKTQREILFGLLTAPPKADPRVETLVAVVADLLMEVEALRRAILASSDCAAAGDSKYGKEYRDTAYLTHNSCGPSSGFEKLLALFYPQSVHEDGCFRRSWREGLMLRRLGFSEEEIDAYKVDATSAELFT